MLFMMIGVDRENGLEARMAARPDHLAFWDRQGDRLKLGGPFLNENEKPCGSVLVFEAESLEAAKGLAAEDPYVSRGVLQSHEVRRWNWVLKKPEGL